MGRGLVGTPTKRVEDRRVLVGGTSFVDDISPPGTLYVSIVRSPYAHAKINQVGFQAALRSNGTIAAFDGREVSEQIKPIPVFVAPSGTKKRTIYPLAVDKVLYVGHPVAALVCSDRYSCTDLAQLVSVDYQPLPAVVDAEKALERGSPVLFEGWGDNLAYATKLEAGDVKEAFRRADHVFRARFRIQRQYGAPLEPRGVVANYDSATKHLTVWSSTQWPHVLRTVLSETLGLEENRIRVIAPDVGGAFGAKQDVYHEEILIPYLSMKLGRPIKWVATRSEEILCTSHAREQVHFLQVAARKDGTILGLIDKILADIGAFHVMSIGPQQVTAATITGPYRITNCAVELQCVVTNKTPSGAYRGFGQPKSTFVLERALDIIAKDLNIDSTEIRFRNFIRPSELPYQTPFGLTYDSGDYAACLRRGMLLIDYQGFRRQQIQQRNMGKTVGLGISFYVETGGLGPSKLFGSRGIKYYSGSESCILRIGPTGKVSVFTGLSPHGQGASTAIAQVCAEEFGIDIDDVLVTHGDTSVTPYGFGTWGSRSAALGTACVTTCARKLKEKMLRIAAHRLSIDPSELVLEAGSFLVRKLTGKSLNFREVTAIAHEGHDLPKGMEPGLEASATYDPPEITASYAVHLAIVEVDAETFAITIHKYVVIEDAGKIINPMLVDGQVQGGLAQGVAGALFEELLYNDSGQILTPTFVEYLLPTAEDVPFAAIEHMETPSPFNPLGVKGIGEGGAIGPPAAIANALADALGSLGSKITETPLRSDRLWKLYYESSKK